MLLSYNWLKQILPSLRRIPPEKMLKFLRAGIANAEGFKELDRELNNKIVVGEIIDITNHPDANKLHLVTVNIGKEKMRVVCGASNIRKGQKVPIALSGAILSKNQVIKSSVIRGVKSNGMLCSEEELGIGSDAKGICIFPEYFKTGQTIINALDLKEVIFNIENKSMNHRPDLFNHLGFVREISAYLNLELKDKIKEVKVKDVAKKVDTDLDIKIQTENICSRYMAVVLDDIKICSSPQWMQNRLRNLGIQPINNVVDIMNYVMLEMGQPLHAFDFDQISAINSKKSKQITIRKARLGEKIFALDEQQYELTKSDIVIADNSGPIALAGLIGGQGSAINNDTKKIIIESANFDPVGIRRMAWRLGLRTEAVLRFEKGLPLVFTEIGIFRAIQLMQEIVGVKVVSKIYDIKNQKGIVGLDKHHNIIFNFEQARKFIGTKVLDKEIIKILKNLNCKICKINSESVSVTPPKYRTDLTIFEDLIEEVIRIHGLDKIIAKPISTDIEAHCFGKEFILEKNLKELLQGCGFDEVYNYAFTSEKTFIEISNPLNTKQQYLRKSLIPGLIDNAIKNIAYFSEFNIFEIGKVFTPKEEKKIAGLVYTKDKDIFCIAKGVVDLIFKELGIKLSNIDYKDSDIYVNKKIIGQISIVKDKFVAFEMDIKSLLNFQNLIKKYVPISSYPPIKRDLAFLIEVKYTWKEIFETIIQINTLVKSIDLFDVFVDKKFGDKRNLAFHIIYQSSTRTLKSEEIDKIQKDIIEVIEKKFNAQLRNF